MKTKIINEILVRLYNDDDNKIDWKILKLQINEALTINIDEATEKEIFQIVTSKDLCVKSYFLTDWNLELTKKGRELIFTHKSYPNYVTYISEEEKKKNEIYENSKKTFKWTVANTIFVIIGTIVSIILLYIAICSTPKT